MFKGQINLDPHKFPLYLIHFLSCYLFLDRKIAKRKTERCYKSRKETKIFVTKQLTSQTARRFYVQFSVSNPLGPIYALFFVDSFACLLLSQKRCQLIESNLCSQSIFFMQIFGYLSKSGFYIFLKYFLLKGVVIIC